MASQKSDRGEKPWEGHGGEQVRELLLRLLRLVAREVAVRWGSARDRSAEKEPGEESDSPAGDDEEPMRGMYIDFQ
jgi:hypothetical protein